MNFLAHLYLTKDEVELVSVGNFMADAIKGKNGYNDYPKDVQRGMEIHREIDAFTDRHKLVKKGTRRLHPRYGKFAPIVVDIYYDHILALNWNKYSDLSLREFSLAQYKMIKKYSYLLPERTKRWFAFMTKHDLLFNYAEEESIDVVFKRMDGRLGNISGMSTAIEELRKFRKEYTIEFGSFFHEIQDHLHEKFGEQ